MKAVYFGGAAALILALTACGGTGDSGNGSASSADLNAPLEQIAAPNGGDWTQVVEQTPEGGFRMGNPNAPVKLVELGSLTCSHCAAFSEEGAPQLENEYVKSGQVSFEFRNFVRDPLDIAAALLTRCGGATPFFKITDQMFAAQAQYMQRAGALDAATQQRLQALPQQQLPAEYARAAGLVDFVKMRGVPESKANACLADQAEMQKLVSIVNTANAQYPGIPGTPAFIINGNLVPDAASWEQLEPALREALK
ncbi:thioredoxin domain-containing protein [Allosphingosinicella flava]|uniref:Thioredoxin domain-containing protein n=1 Tax=Allosphingosinicella flava TaxID=2771430 RepID=A0A7T2GJU2_9SPHN|nr:thioredoxin domain-containing protein [Sphingosinicella flava]QPQ54813.1 thioredoxin domain-containing protein [Sphingosinicella flava]